jgi:hypothetical protein
VGDDRTTDRNVVVDLEILTNAIPLTALTDGLSYFDIAYENELFSYAVTVFEPGLTPQEIFPPGKLSPSRGRH